MARPAQSGRSSGVKTPDERRAALGLFCVALAVRLVHLWQLRPSPFWSVLLGDAAGYDAWARTIAAGDWLGREVFYQAPLYPYLLGALYHVFGPDTMTIRIVQAFLGATATLLIALAARRLFGPRMGIAAGLILAFYAPAIFFDGLIQKASLDLVLTCWLLWLVTLLLERPTRSRSAWAGIAVGSLVLTRENALAFVPLLFIWLRGRPERGRTFAATFLVAAGLTMTPVTVRNFALSGEVHLTTSQFGPNLFIGNHEGATGTYMPLRKGRGNVTFENADAIQIAEAASGRALSPGEVSRYWTGRALRWTFANPVEWFELSLRKLRLAWNAVESTDTEDLYSHAEWSFPLRACDTLLHFGVLAPLGLFGVWLTRARLRELWILHAMAAVYVLSLILFYVVARYRFPLSPFLVLFAAAGLVGLKAWYRESTVAGRLQGLALLAVAAGICNWPMQSVTAMKALTRYNLGEAHREAGRPEQAIEQFKGSLQLDSANSAAASNLGALLAEKGDHEEALRLYDRAIVADPENAAAHNNLGQELAARGELPGAIASFRRSIEIDPQGAGPHHNLGLALATSGRVEDAIREFEEAVRLEPAHAGAHNNLGILLASTGRLEEGIEHFKMALRVRPAFPEAAANLARAEAERRRP